LCGGIRAAFPQRSLADPALKSAREAIDLVLRAHDRTRRWPTTGHWNLVTANDVMPLLKDIRRGSSASLFNILRSRFTARGWARARSPRRMVGPSPGAAAPPVRGDADPS